MKNNVQPGIVIVNKPAGMTSHDVIARLRRIFQTRKIGHAGTLDPMATGVLIAGVERGTKFLAHMVADDKRYIARIRLGASTLTDDREGELCSRVSVEKLSSIRDEDIFRALDTFRGSIMQKPTQVSAIKINGKRAYALVREGEKVDIPARPVEIFSLEVLSGIERTLPQDLDEYDPCTAQDWGIECTIAVHCSSGTYMRAIARDLGELLGVGGFLTDLHRTSVGPFTIKNALSLEDLEQEARLSHSLDEALSISYPVLKISDREARDLSEGKWLEPRGLRGVHAAVAPDGRAIALVQENKKRLRTIFVARPSTL